MPSAPPPERGRIYDVCDEVEFGALLVEAFPKLAQRCRALTKDQDRALDLAQAAAEKALRSREQFRRGTNFYGWIFMIARNLWLSDCRRAWRVVEMAEGQAERVPAPASQQHTLEAKEALAALEFLPSEMADAVLAAADGLTMEEIASTLGIEEGTAKSRISRGRSAIQAFFGDH